MQADGLVLRDIHAAVAPGWWPPAPGWWGVAALVLLTAGGLVAWRLRVRWQRRRAGRLFDRSVQASGSPAARVAEMSTLLRRAARRRNPASVVLEGDDWVGLVSASVRPASALDAGLQALLLHGPYRRDVPAADVERLRVILRPVFVHWMLAP